MKLYHYPSPLQWPEIIKRPAANVSALYTTIAPIMEAVRSGGDAAVQKYTADFDQVHLESLQVTDEEMAYAIEATPQVLKEAIMLAAKNISSFHTAQIKEELNVETMPGVVCRYKSIPLEKVGLYIPGGTAPLFSTILMLALPAKIAGCKEVILCTPPSRDGHINAAILYAAHFCGIHKIYKVGGAQAIAALCFGTETIPAVHKIFGPGNAYVTAAKQLAQQYGIAIDMPAGPSEVCVLADDTANAKFVAADLLSQAEHGKDSQVVLITTHEKLLHEVQKEIKIQMAILPRADIIEQALIHSKAVLVESMQQGIDIANAYAAEHLIICCENEEAIAAQIHDAGSIFLGNYSPESAGDYASGTNHTLPTNGYARMYSGVNLDSFMKKISIQKISKSGLSALGNAIITMAEAEGLAAHAAAVKIRLEK